MCSRFVSSCMIGLLALAAADNAAHAQDGYAFNTSFLRGDNKAVDLGDLLGSGILPGSYEVSVFLNQNLKLRRQIDFVKNPRTGMVEACIDSVLLDALKINTSALLQDHAPASDDALGCLDLPLINPQASQHYLPGKFHLKLSIPQLFLLPEAQDYVDPALWDYGVPAAFVNYNMAFSNNRHDGDPRGKMSSLSSSFNSGINLFGWRYRNTSSLMGSNRDSLKFASFTNYLEHDIDRLKAQLRIGDVFASSRLLDSVGLRGVQLKDDLSMQPGVDSMHRPIIQGNAESNATVEIRQHGFLLHTTTVPPGPFRLDNIQAGSSTGDLEVTIIEADGRRRVSIVPWGTNAYMVRKGFFTYDAAIGKYRQSGSSHTDMMVASIDYTYGLFDNLSLLGGMQLTNRYTGIGIGLGTNTPIGPIALDIQHSISKTDQGRRSGSSFRLSYAKNFNESGTNFTLATQRFSTEGFRSLSAHAQYLQDDPNSSRTMTPKLSTSINISQNLQRYGLGSAYLSLADSTYWNHSGRMTSLSAGYSGTWRNIGYSISVSHSRNMAARNSAARDDTSIGLSISIPLGAVSRNPANLSASVNTSSHGRATQTASLSSSINIHGHHASYSVFGSGERGKFDNLGVNVAGRTPFVSYAMNGTSGKGFTTYGGSLSGGAVLHSGGLNLSSSVNETMILADVGGQAGVNVNGSARTGSNGYAVIASAAPYRMNQVLVDGNLPSDIDVSDTSAVSVVPRRGAVVQARFEIRQGRRIEFTVFDADGRKLPFGSVLYDDKDQRLGITDPFGKAMVLLEQTEGSIKAAWDGRTCFMPYALGPKNDALYYEKTNLRCE